ncbi:MAG: hypothetical protein PHP01_06380, partial [Phycisphaerae bacterium]|nr:hypothetical protein [Phycisphaerae bacterium]
MSTLTKILIVLLSLFSIYLCATIVTYIGTADNYKSSYEQQGKVLASLKEKNKGYQDEIAEKKRQIDQFSLKLDSDVSGLKTEKDRLEQELKNIKSAKLEAEEKVKSLTAAALNFEKTVGGMEGSLKETRQELDQARAEGIRLAKNLEEVTASLEEKIAQLASLDAEKKRLLEEKTNLERQVGGTGGSARLEPITTVPDSAAQALEMPAVVSLKGVITAVEG